MEWVNQNYGSIAPIASALKEGKLLGVVNLVGCNPRIIYEKAVVELASILIENIY